MQFGDLGTPLEEVTFVVVDLETTGGRPGAHAITEFGAVKVQGGEELGQFSTLVNPGVPIPPQITLLTGITTGMVAEAPSIDHVLPAFLDFVGTDAVLVAHNARFDVGHLKVAAKELGIPWPRFGVVDTLALSRRVFTRDEVPNHKLGTLAAYCHAAVSPTHRALDDARATVDVLHTMLERLGPLGVTHLEDLRTATDRVPAKRRRKASLADGLPHSPGVYRFLGPRGEVLYVGTSVNVYKRVRQYFTASESRRRMGEMVDLARKVEATATETVLQASVEEVREIAAFDPPYNRRSRRPQNKPWLELTEKPHLRLKVARGIPEANMETSLGPFGSGSQARGALELINDEAGLRGRGLGIARRSDLSDTPCTVHTDQEGRPCCVLPPRGTLNAPEVARLRAAEILAGKLDAVWAHAKGRLRRLSTEERFEQASIERDRLQAVLTAAKRREKLLPILRAAEIRAASYREDHWEVAVVRWGKLVAAARVPSDQFPPDILDALARTAPEVKRPTRAGGATHIEESEILADWLTDPNTRVLSVESEWPLALPINAAARFSLPQPVDLPPAFVPSDGPGHRRPRRS